MSDQLPNLFDSLNRTMCGGDMSPYSVMSVARNLCWDLTSEGQKRMLTPSPQLRRSGGLEERRKFPTGVRGGKRVLEYLELEKTHVIATNLSYLTFLRHIFIVTFTITKRKTFTYIFVPFAQLKRLCNIFSLLLGA